MQNYTIFPFYRADEMKKVKLRYISFKLICLSLYMIGFYYIFLNIILENTKLENVKISKVYERNLGEAQKNNNGVQWEKKVKDEKEDIDKTKDNVNDLICNAQKVEENMYSISYDTENNNVKYGRNISISSINNNNDMSTFLTEKELYEVLNSLEACPSKEDLKILWSHTIGVAKEGFDDIQKELKESIQKIFR
ncbi:Plasmodium exported protein (PHIST), unknown, putative [Plasmodium sp.]|nr:Plasmodium exported protein (PHIST), unknown, putative [Plasmodium sp.]